MKNKIIFLSCLALIGIINDVLLSVSYYLKDPLLFIENESNKEFVAFLTEGSFPFALFISIVGVFFFCYCILYASEFESEYQSFLYGSYAFTCIFVFILRTLAGSSWYIKPISILPYVRLLQLLVVSCLSLFTAFYLYICVIEPKRKLNAIPKTNN